jgi:glycosyltransferase involved in cell wall biosynthesis
MPNHLRRVYLEPTWNLHGFQHQLLSFPPAGYEFIAAGKPNGELFRTLARHDKARTLLISLDAMFPTSLAKSWLERWTRPPSDAVLTYSVDHLIFRPEPWVVEMEYACASIGIHPKHLKRFKGVVEKTLSSPHCKRIFCWSEAGRRSLVADLEPTGFEHKCEIVHYAVPSKSFAKHYGATKIRLLFVGSGSSNGAFEWRGSGLFEMYAILRREFKNLQLVVRSDVPEHVRARYSSLEDVRIIDGFVPRTVLEQEFQSADIFIFPSYTTAPLTILEAMSYELPTVTVDAWANSEYVEDGKTGLVIPRSTNVPFYYPGTLQPNFLEPAFIEALRSPEQEVVAQLVRSVRLLIENPQLRRQMGRSARQAVEVGKFSLATMNGKLKRAFDEIVASN